MLGPAKPRRLDAPITVSLEDLVPENNFYRHLEEKLDLGFVRDWTRELYAARGRPGIDLAVFDEELPDHLPSSSPAGSRAGQGD
jgi:hypothetical protein